MNWKGLMSGLPAVMLAAALLPGCSSETAQQGKIEASTPTVSTPVVSKAAESGSVTIAVKFPKYGSQAGKAIIDNRTEEIQLYVEGIGVPYMNNYILTPDPTTGIATLTFELPVGKYSFSASAYSYTLGAELERTETAGEIRIGANTVVLTFASGDWQFVDANNVPTALTLTNSSGGTTLLDGFAIKPTSIFQAGPGPAKAMAPIDRTLPRGYQDYALGFFTDETTPQLVGPALWADAQHQFAGATYTSGFTGGWLNLDNPANSEALFSTSGSPLATGERVAFILGNGDGPGGNATMVDGNGNDMTPAFNTIADTGFIDGKTMAGHLLEMTMGTETRNVTASNVDCAPYWQAQGAGAARAAAISQSLASRVGKAAVGDTTFLAASMTVGYEECDARSTIDLDGDGDYYSGDYLTYDFNGNGLYDPADGDTYYDYNGDGNFDSVTYLNPIDGDGDGDFADDGLYVDFNHNGRYDPADGDQFTDYNADGNFDYTYWPGTVTQVTETYSDVKAIEFRARAQQANSVYVFGPPQAAVIIQ